MQQTPAPIESGGDETLINAYLANLNQIASSLHREETHLAVDGQFAKQKWLDGVEVVGLHTVGKLNCDAYMCFFYTGPRRAQGSDNQKTYDGKVA